MTSSTIRIKIKDEKHDYAKAIDVSPKESSATWRWASRTLVALLTSRPGSRLSVYRDRRELVELEDVRRKRTAARPRKSAVRPENNGHSNIDLALEALDTIKDMARAVGPLTDVAAIARKLHEELAPTAFGHSDLIKDLGRALEQLDAGEAA